MYIFVGKKTEKKAHLEALDDIQNKRLELEKKKLEFEETKHRDNHALELRRLAMAEKAQEMQAKQNELLYMLLKDRMEKS